MPLFELAVLVVLGLVASALRRCRWAAQLARLRDEGGRRGLEARRRFGLALFGPASTPRPPLTTYGRATL